MHFFKRLSLGNRLLGAFGLLTLVALGIGGTGMWGLKALTDQIEEIGEVRLPSVQALMDLEQAQAVIKGVEGQLLYEEGAAAHGRHLDALAAQWEEAESAWAVYAPLPQTPKESRLWTAFQPQWEAWRTSHEELVGLIDQRASMVDAGERAGSRRMVQVEAGISEVVERAESDYR